MVYFLKSVLCLNFSFLLDAFTFVYLIDHEWDTLNLGLVQYCFDDVEHSVIPRPHANFKQSQSFVRTITVTLQRLLTASFY